jgi:Domain of Unknown Function (DUF1080)
MSTPAPRHPDDRLLVAFNLSKLDQRQVALVNQHLKQCQTCRKRLRELAGERQVPLSPVSNPTARPVARPVWKNPIWMAAGGLALVGIVIGWSVGIFTGPKFSDSTEAKTGPLSPTIPEPPHPSKETVQAPVSQPNAEEPANATTTPSLAPRAPVESEVSRTEKTPKPAVAAAAAPTALARIDPQPSRPAATESASETPPAKSDDPSTSFFDGKDLMAWDGEPGVWHVENGTITASFPAGRMQSAWLCSRRKYKDFDLMFRATLADAVNDCGVQFRSHASNADKRQIAGPACAIYGKDASPEHRTGSLVIEPGGKVEKAPPAKRVETFVEPGENHFRIRCQGKHILIEVNGIKMVNGEFPSLPDEGIIAWKIDAGRPPHKVTFKSIKFTDLAASQAAPERPSLFDTELLKAELKYETAMKKADETLLNHFDPEITRLKRGGHEKERGLVGSVEREKENFKEKGLVPWSRPMRKWLLQYGKELHEAQRAVGAAFDSAIERAEKNHNENLKAALLAEAGEVLVPREVATWQHTGSKGSVFKRIFYSDGTFSEGEQQEQTTARFWTPPIDDVLILEFPDKENSAGTDEQSFLLSPDGQTLTGTSKKGNKQVWQHADGSTPNDGS